jgi:CRP-like cAMP-binding protein
MITPDDIARILFFEDLPWDELKVVAGYMTMRQFAKGEVVFYEGDAANGMCFVVEGSVNIGKEAGDGTIKTVSIITQHGIFGEMALIDGSRRSATAVARSDVTVGTLSKDGFEKLIEVHPKLAIWVTRKIARVISLRLRKTSADFVDIMPG